MECGYCKRELDPFNESQMVSGYCDIECEETYSDKYLTVHPAKQSGTTKPTAKEAAMAKQVGGSNYKQHSIQPWDIIDEYGLDFYEGNALKYLLREKGNRKEDIEKCIHYLEKKLTEWTEEHPNQGRLDLCNE